MDTTRSLTETFMSNLAQFDNMRWMKFNYHMTRAMELDDPNFVHEFNKAWETLKEGGDVKALIYFYKTYIEKENQSDN